MNFAKLDNKPLPSDVRIDRLSRDELMMVYTMCKLTLEEMAEIEVRLGVRPARAA